MKKIFLELVKEACSGKVIVDGEEWPYSFNTIIEDKDFYENENNLSTLVIKDLDKLMEKLEEYITLELILERKTLKIYSGKEEDRIKWLISNLIANMTTEDFLNPVLYVEKYMEFLKDKTFNYLDDGITIKLPKVKESELEIKREQNNTSMETPYKITLTLKKNKEEFTSFKLPSIYYAIREENNEKVCYIYSVMNKDNKKLSEEALKFQNKINRLLYKLNAGVVDSEEYYNYLEKTRKLEENPTEEREEIYYPEDNISDITNSFLFSLNIFMSLLQKEGIKTVKVVPYLPVRYNSRALAALEKTEEEERKQLEERNDMIQTNATNKLIRTFRRLSYQNDAVQITTYPYEMDEFLTIKLGSRDKELENMLLEESNDIINNEIKEK